MADSDITLVSTPLAVRRQMLAFQEQAPKLRGYARKLMRQTTYWVYDTASSSFGPSKYIGLDNMPLSRYHRVAYSQIDGGSTRMAIARSLKSQYIPRPEMHASLNLWGDALVGPNAFDGIAADKWLFIVIPHERAQIKRVKEVIGELEFERRARAYSKKSLPELMQLHAANASLPRTPTVRVNVLARARDPLVVAIARARARDRCEVPRCGYRPFETVSGSRFVEVHHIVTLADGGPDEPENVVCLCPNHHRELHHGRDAHVLRDVLLRVRSKTR